MLEMVIFIKTRLNEIERLIRQLSESNSIDIQAAVDQMDRLRESVNSTIDFVQHNPNSPLGTPVLKKIAQNWAYHQDFKKEWR